MPDNENERQPGRHDPEIKFWVALDRVYGLGPVRFARLEHAFDTMEEAWRASLTGLLGAGLEPKAARELDAAREHIDPDAEMDRLHELGIAAVPIRSDSYPPALRETHNAPAVLYVHGKLDPDNTRNVAVVGARRMTPYGSEMTRRIAGDLAAAGVTVFSGLARGIDGVAHRAALDAGGRTVAVVGGGLDSIYPAEHTSLASDIVAAGGAIVSEYPLGTFPKPEHFPRRNRVISGLTRGVVVVEGKRTSGAMITVKWALEQDREVFAVPGRVLSENSEGPNWLIQQGAKLVTGYMDVLDELRIEPAPLFGAEAQPPPVEGTQGQLGVDSLARIDNEISIESRIIEHMQRADGLTHIDEITRSVGEPIAAVTSAMTVLEIKGRVRQVGPMQFATDQPARAPQE